MAVKLYELFILVTVSPALAQWLKHYATSRKVAGSGPDAVNGEWIFPIYLVLPVASVSNRNEYHKQKNKVSGKQSAAGA
jgi:hypothetical protein